MARDLRVKVRLTADTKQAQKSIKGFSSSFGALRSAIGGFTIAAAAVGLAIGKIISKFNEWITAANVQEDAISALNAQLSKFGKQSASISKALQDQASALQLVTKFGDEVTISAQTQLAVFANSEQSLLDLTVATQDFATAQGIDLESAAKLLAKTLGSTTNALVRYGIEVNGAASSTERADSIVNAISTLFGGRATEAAKTYSGALAQVANASGDIQESFGAMITQSETLIKAQNELARELSLFNRELDTTPGFIAGVVTAWTDFKILMVDTARVLNGIEEQQFESIQAIRNRAIIARSNAAFDKLDLLEKIELEKQFQTLIDEEIRKGKEANALILQRSEALIAAGIRTREEIQSNIDKNVEQIEIIKALGDIGELSQLQVAEATAKLAQEQDALGAVLDGTASSVSSYKASLIEAGIASSNLREVTRATTSGMSELGGGFDIAGQQANQFGFDIDRLNGKLARASATAQRLNTVTRSGPGTSGQAPLFNNLDSNGLGAFQTRSRNRVFVIPGNNIGRVS